MIDPATRARAVEMYADGMIARDVAAQLGVGETSVLAWVRQSGITVRRTGWGTDSPARLDPARWVQRGLVMRYEAP